MSITHSITYIVAVKQIFIIIYITLFYKYGIYVHGCVDGNSRFMAYLNADARTACVAFHAFVFDVQKNGIPSRIRVVGMKIGLIKKLMVVAKLERRGWSLKCHNQRIERL